MKILVACEYSGVVRRAFRNKGHDAWSCDLLESDDGSEYHLQQDVIPLLSQGWDMLIAHPPCTYLTVSGLHHNKNNPWRRQQTEEALKFVEKFFECSIEKKCIENPVSIISTRISKPTQIIQPYEFGEDASKKTCLWLQNLPKLVGTKYIEPRITADGKKRWSNQTDSGQNKLGPSEDRWKIRSKTYQGIADAMAEQWGVT